MLKLCFVHAAKLNKNKMLPILHHGQETDQERGRKRKRKWICKEFECTKHARRGAGQGFCQKHGQTRGMWQGCAAEGCGKAAHTKGYCREHRPLQCTALRKVIWTSSTDKSSADRNIVPKVEEEKLFGDSDDEMASAVATEVMPWFDAEPCMPETTIEIFEEGGSINGNYFKRQFYGFTEDVPRGMMQTGSYRKKGILIRL